MGCGSSAATSTSQPYNQQPIQQQQQQPQQQGDPFANFPQQQQQQPQYNQQQNQGQEVQWEEDSDSDDDDDNQRNQDPNKPKKQKKPRDPNKPKKPKDPNKPKKKKVVPQQQQQGVFANITQNAAHQAQIQQQQQHQQHKDNDKDRGKALDFNKRTVLFAPAGSNQVLDLNGVVQGNSQLSLPSERRAQKALQEPFLSNLMKNDERLTIVLDIASQEGFALVQVLEELHKQKKIKFNLDNVQLVIIYPSLKTPKNMKGLAISYLYFYNALSIFGGKKLDNLFFIEREDWYCQNNPLKILQKNNKNGIIYYPNGDETQQNLRQYHRFNKRLYSTRAYVSYFCQDGGSEQEINKGMENLEHYLKQPFEKQKIPHSNEKQSNDVYLPFRQFVKGNNKAKNAIVSMGNDSEKIVKKIANRAQNDCNDVKIEEHVNKKTKFGWIIATPQDKPEKAFINFQPDPSKTNQVLVLVIPNDQKCHDNMIPMLAWGIDNATFIMIVSEKSANTKLDDFLAPLLDSEIDVEDILFHLSPFPRLKVYVPFLNQQPLLEDCSVKFDINDSNSIFGCVEINTDIPIKPAAIIKRGKFDFIPNSQWSIQSPVKKCKGGFVHSAQFAMAVITAMLKGKANEGQITGQYGVKKEAFKDWESNVTDLKAEYQQYSEMDKMGDDD